MRGIAALFKKRLGVKHVISVSIGELRKREAAPGLSWEAAVPPANAMQRLNSYWSNFGLLIIDFYWNYPCLEKFDIFFAFFII